MPAPIADLNIHTKFSAIPFDAGYLEAVSICRHPILCNHFPRFSPVKCVPLSVTMVYATPSQLRHLYRAFKVNVALAIFVKKISGHLEYALITISA